MKERLQKVLARAGLASRRELERMIEAGRIQVNGQTATLGTKVDGSERIQVDGQLIGAKRMQQSFARTLIYHKPEGEICASHDPEGRPTIFTNLPRLKQGRWINVGRLDINTSGLILLTTDGELANRLMHPSWEIERTYAVRVLGELTEIQQQALLDGVTLDDGPAKLESLQTVMPPEDEEQGGVNRWYHVTLREGRNREVRRLFESQGCAVSRLIRIAYGPIRLPRHLPRGKHRELSDNALRHLYEAVQLSMPEREADGKVTQKRAPRRPASPRAAHRRKR